MQLLGLSLTGVYPCSCNSPNLPSPDTQIRNTDGRVFCQTCITKWLGKGCVGTTCFSNKKNLVMFWPPLEQFKAAGWLLSQNKNYSWHQTNCCNFLSLGRFRRQPVPTQACWISVIPYKNFEKNMHFFVFLSKKI